MKKIILLQLLLLCFSPEAPGEEGFPPPEWLEREWFGVYLLGQKAGYGFSELRAEPGGGHTLLSGVRYRADLPGGPQEMNLEQEFTFGPDGLLASFRRNLDSPLGGNKAAGQRVPEGFLVLSEGAGKLVPAPPISLRDALAERTLAREAAPEGTETAGLIFDLDLGGPVRTVSRVTAVRETYPGGVPSRFWEISTTMEKFGLILESVFSRDGRTVSTQVGGALRLQAESEESAKTFHEGWDYLNHTRVKPAGTPAALPGIGPLELLIEGIPPDFTIPSSPRQKVSPRPGGAVLTLRRQPRPAGSVPFPVQNPEMALWLEDTPFLQVSDPKIANLAREIGGNAPDSLAAAEALNDWVYRNLKKDFVLGLPDAFSVLRAGRGDCKGHSAALIALTRALGIPARFVCGLASGPDGFFYYHQWTEVWVGEWFPLDPAFGLSGASPGHIAFFRGALPDLLGIARILGSVRIAPAPAEDGP